MSNYPDWVLKYKEKGTYINHVNGRYYIYAAHSERVPGTKKVKRICDAYLGRITEKEGLIPPKDKVSGVVTVYEFGLSTTILNLCDKIYLGYKRRFKHNADFVFIATILSVIYGCYNQEIFKHSYLSIQFPSLDLNKRPTDKQHTAIQRGILMIKDTLSNFFGSDLLEITNCFQHVYKVKINNLFYRSKESETVDALKKKYGIEWEESTWLK